MKKGRLSTTLSRLALREVIRSYAQSLAIVAIGSIAVTLFIGLQANAGSMQERIDEMVVASSPADLYITTDPHDLSSGDDSDFILKNLDKGDYLESRFYSLCTIESSSASLVISPFLPTISTAYDVQLSPVSTESDYFYVGETFARAKKEKTPGMEVLGFNASIDFDLGDVSLPESTLSALDHLLNEGQVNPFREKKLLLNSPITGVMKHPENSTMTSPIPAVAMMSSLRFRDSVVASLEKSFSPFGVELIYREGFYKMLGWGDGKINGDYYSFPTPNQYLVRLQDKSTLDHKKEVITEAYKKDGDRLYSLQTLNSTTWMATLQNEVDQADKLTYVFPVVFFLVAVLVILTTLRQSILKRRSEIGVFKAIGLKKSEIHAHFLSQTGLLVLLSCLIGSIIGPFLIPEIMAKKYNILYALPTRTYLFPVGPGLLAMAIFLAVSLLVTFLITYKEIALRPVESMRPKTMKTHRRFLKSNLIKPSPLSLSAKMAGRNMLYDPVKAFMVVLGVAGCTMLLICGFGIDDTLEYDIHQDPFVNSSAAATAHFITPQEQASLKGDMAALRDKSGNPIVTDYQAFDHYSLEVLHEETAYTTYLFMLGDNVSLTEKPAPWHMVCDFPKDQVLLSTKVAGYLNAKQGDRLKFYVGDAYVEPVVHIVYDAFYGNGIVFHADSPLLKTPYTRFSSAWVNSYTSEDALVEALGTLSYIPVVESASTNLQRIRDLLSSISTMTAAVKVFALLLAATVVYNLGLLNFRERTREIATLKVLGFHTLEIGIGLLIEALSMTLIGILGGLALGYPFMKLVLMVNQVEIIQFIYHIEPWTFLIGAGFSFLVAILVNLALTYRIKNVKSVESLKSVE